MLLGSLLLVVCGMLALFPLSQFPYRLSHEQGIDYKRTYFLTIVCFSCGLLFGVAASYFVRRESTRLNKIGILGCVLLSLIGLAMLCFNSNWGIHSISAP